MVPTVLPPLRGPRADPGRRGHKARSLSSRLGLTVPHEWWAAPALLKSFDAAGFTCVQLDAPPPAVLARREHRRRHSSALAAALQGTRLVPILHAPAGLRLGSAGGGIGVWG